MEIAASAVSWADRQAAHHRESLSVWVSQVIREGLIALGIDPRLALSLRRGDDAATELLAILDTAELKAADEAMMRLDNYNCMEFTAGR